MYRVTVEINNGEILVKSVHCRYTETPDSYAILFDDGRLMDRVKKEMLDVPFDFSDIERLKVLPQIMWTFDPENAKELLLIRVANEIQKRIDYVNSIKHLI